MLMTTELIRAISEAVNAFQEILANPVISGIRLVAELLVATLTPALIDRHARHSSRVLK